MSLLSNDHHYPKKCRVGREQKQFHTMFDGQTPHQSVRIRGVDQQVKTMTVIGKIDCKIELISYFFNVFSKNSRKTSSYFLHIS